jgi:hypothetical protein
MTLLAPWALWFSIIGGAVIALYLLKIKRRQQRVPALEFWRELAGKTKVHSLFERLKRLLSMLLWLLIAACLVLALGNPLLSLGKIKPKSIAVIIDNSASMQTLEPSDSNENSSDQPSNSATRLKLAIEALAEITSRRPVNDQWLLIEAARQPRVLQSWTYDQKAVRKTADAMQPFGGSGDLKSAIELAHELLTGKPEPLIVVISDGSGEENHLAISRSGDFAIERESPSTTTQPQTSPDRQIAKSPNPPHALWPIGSTRDNLGITALRVRLHRQQSTHHVLVSVVNSSDHKIDSQLTFEIDGVTHSVELLSIESNSAWDKTIVIETPGGAGGVLRASIDRVDALALDNEAYAVLEPIRPAVVWLVTPPDESFFFEQALSAMDPLVWPDESITLAIDQFEGALAAAEKSDSLRSPDLVIFNNAAPKKLPPRGDFVFINAWPDDLSAKVEGDLEAPQLFIAPKAHPLTQYLNLQGVRLAKAKRVNLQDRATVLAHSADGDPLVFLHEQPDRRSLCMAFDVLESDLPFRNAFPLLLRNAVAHLHSEKESWIKPEYRIGETVEPLRAIPTSAKPIELATARQGKIEPLQIELNDGRFRWDGTISSMPLRCTIGEEVAFAAVNLADANESRIAPAERSADVAEQLVLSGRLFGAMPWIGFAAIALGLIALEWLTYHFRWTE